ncbi:MAG: O-acetyl-ADP-ribose deacetylase [Rhodothermaceae bacterium]
MKHISVVKADITKLDVDVIVNAANTTLLGGGGVDGAIHRAAGPELLEECKKFNGCETGEARITKGYNLTAKYVVHTPGPVWKGGKKNEAELLKNSYRNSLLLAQENCARSIAFPSISTGVYGYPKQDAAKIAYSTVVEFLKETELELNVVFVCFSEEDYKIYKGLAG